MSEWKDFFLSAKDVQWLDFKKVFSWHYLSDTALSYHSPLIAFLGYAFLAVVIIGVILYFVLSHQNKRLPIFTKVMGHVINLSLWLGILGIIFVLARFQGIYLLSSRFLILGDILAILIWTGWIVYYSIAKLPKLAEDYKKQQAINKYLPKKKNHKVRL